MTTPPEVLSRIREEAQRDALITYPRDTGNMSWAIQRDAHSACYERLKLAEWERERFTKPTDQQYCDIAVLFNDGHVDQEQLTKMIAMAEFIVDRLHYTGDVTKPTPKELQSK
jgi:hypothetical protein